MLTRRDFIVGMTALGAGCLAGELPPAKPAPGAHPGFPFHPLVFHIDLSILAYQLYGQTLVWPFDPYYEELNSGAGDRAAFMKKVWAWARETGAVQQGRRSVLNDYRGPGVLGGFAANERHDPIVYRYGLVDPWSPCINNLGKRWVVYETPTRITERIRDVYVAYRRAGGGVDDVVVERGPVKRPAWTREPAADVLLCFEGGTGGKGEARQPHSQSLMGCVLLRWSGGSSYDLHISFRGSRSGSAARALWQALSDEHARGNPDWITDVGYDPLEPNRGGRVITTVGTVHRGFARSMESILPRLFACLGKVAELARGAAPRRIYATGHSLGGALAQHFVSAILQGCVYGPGGTGEQMPAELATWPWKQLKLITFGAPRAGDERWAKSLTEQGLASEFFSALFSATDDDALSVTDSGIVPRLLSAEEPAGYRVLISSDPITTEKVGGGGKHVGKTVYVDQGRSRPVGFAAHELATLRDYVTATFADGRIANLTDADLLVPQLRAGAFAELTPLRGFAGPGLPQDLAKLGAWEVYATLVPEDVAFFSLAATAGAEGALFASTDRLADGQVLYLTPPAGLAVVDQTGAPDGAVQGGRPWQVLGG
jgi:hypothetical protein